MAEARASLKRTLANRHAAESSPPAGDVRYPRLVTTSLDSVKSKPVRWTVPDWIPQGKCVLLAGDGGIGKSSISTHLAACFSTGRPAFGLEYKAPAPFKTLFFALEDDPADTMKPRVQAEGGDCSRVLVADGIETERGKITSFGLEFVEALADAIRADPEIRFVVIDPIASYLGENCPNEFREADVRRVLQPLIELASDTGVTFLLVKHFNKGEGLGANRVSGSVAYVNVCRHVFFAVPIPGQEGSLGSVDG